MACLEGGAARHSEYSVLVREGARKVGGRLVRVRGRGRVRVRGRGRGRGRELG